MKVILKEVEVTALRAEVIQEVREAFKEQILAAIGKLDVPKLAEEVVRSAVAQVTKQQLLDHVGQRLGQVAVDVVTTELGEGWRQKGGMTQLIRGLLNTSVTEAIAVAAQKLRATQDLADFAAQQQGKPHEPDPK